MDYNPPFVMSSRALQTLLGEWARKYAESMLISGELRAFMVIK